MKIQNVTDVDKFFKVIDECKGTVELVSPDGDRINLKVQAGPVCVHCLYLRKRLYPGTGSDGP